MQMPVMCPSRKESAAISSEALTKSAVRAALHMPVMCPSQEQSAAITFEQLTSCTVRATLQMPVMCPSQKQTATMSLWCLELIRLVGFEMVWPVVLEYV